jgi:hypothetical protein
VDDGCVVAGPVQYCGTTSACSATAQLLTRIVYGSAALVTGTPSSVTISGISPAFTSATSYRCTATEQGSSITTPVTISSYVSSSSFTISGGATDTDIVSYVCVGT